MRSFILNIKNDFNNFIKYRIFHMIIIVSLVFALAMGIFPRIDPALFIYISIFIIPIITHAITLFIEKEEDTLLSKESCETCYFKVILTKTLSALLLQIIPLVFYLIVFIFVLNVNFNLWLFTLVYLIATIIHIFIGFAITLIAKNYISMVLIYAAFIIFISFIPFLFLMNFIPESLLYLFIFSPGFLFSILFENIIFGYLYSDILLLILAIILPLIYGSLIFFFILKPYYKNILTSRG